jgi:hypothetical protein
VADQHGERPKSPSLQVCKLARITLVSGGTENNPFERFTTDDVFPLGGCCSSHPISFKFNPPDEHDPMKVKRSSQ